MTLWGQSNSKHEHERIPSSLSECLEKERPSNRRLGWRSRFLVLLLIPTLYCINHLISSETRVTERSLQRLKYHNVVGRKNKAVLMNITRGKTREQQNENTAICVLDNNHLGKFTIKTPRKVILENQYPAISNGGYFSPEGCRSRHKVAVLVPYRDRKENLAMFLDNIHPFLMKQKLEYRIFVVEQEGSGKFNKGRLFNAGYSELKKFGAWHCIVFHDVDLLPLDERILYSCPFWPRHMCASVVHRNLDPSYRSLFGGVTSMTPAQYERVNGYSNLYWGWGGEDFDMFWRLRFASIPVTRYNKTIARYLSMPHRISSPNPLRYLILHNGLGKFKQEGLSTLEYKLVSFAEKHLYTHIVVDINPGEEKLIND